MSALPREIIDRFKRLGWKSNPYDHFEALVFGASGEVAEFVHGALDEWPTSTTFLNDLISFLPEQEFASVVSHALEVVSDSEESETAADVIAHCSEQMPATLHPHLDRLFELRPNASTYYAAFPWRESNDVHFDFLRLKATGFDEDDAAFAVEGLLESRTSRALQAVLELRDATSRTALHQVGFASEAMGLHALYAPDPQHICLPRDAIGGRPMLPSEKHHPTWVAAANHPRRRFGGTGGGNCAVCGGRSHHLITLEAAELRPTVTSRAQLTLETCLSCLGWEAPLLFHRHDAAGKPHPMGYEGERKEPQFPAVPFPELEAAIVPAMRRWRWQEWGSSNHRQNLHRIGGHPCWVQNADYPACPQCDRTMSFLLQFDSYVGGSGWLWGSGGICYVMWCDACGVSAQFWQCT